MRNVLIAIGNSGEPSLAGEAERLLVDTSALVRASAVWALSQLMDRNDFAALASSRAGEEPDPEVRAEWLATA